MFFKIDLRKNFAIFTRKYLYWRPATLLKETPTKVLSCEYCEIFKNSFSYKTPLVAASVMQKVYQYDFDILIVQDGELVDILEDMQLRSNLVEKQ